MNRLILIGNGFDLAHGLKTSFKDFIHSYLIECVNTFQQKNSYKDELIEISAKYYNYPFATRYEINSEHIHVIINDLIKSSEFEFIFKSPFFEKIY